VRENWFLGLTEHGAILPEGGLACPGVVFGACAVSDRVRDGSEAAVPLADNKMTAELAGESRRERGLARCQGTGAYAGSVSKDVLIVGHRVHVVTGFAEYQTALPDKQLLRRKLHEFYQLALHHAAPAPRKRRQSPKPSVRC
jgi:hypothetical protein